MKKQVLFSAILASTFCSGQAQITINANNVAEIGDRVVIATDNTPQVIGSSGANQNWNFSNLAQNYLDTLSFTNPAWTYCSTDYPEANLAMTHTAEDSTTFYFYKDNSYFIGKGYCMPSSGSFFPMHNNSIQLAFPVNYNDQHVFTSRTVAVKMAFGADPDGPAMPHPYVDSLRMTKYEIRNQLIDGWGTLTLPSGNFNVLRENTVTIEVDTVWMLAGGTWQVISPLMANLLSADSIVYDTTYTVNWWSDDANTKYPVLSMDYDYQTGTSNWANWLVEGSLTSIPENVNKSVKIYPNPVKSSDLIIEGDGISFIKVYDVTGKLIYSCANSNNTKVVVPTHLYNKGLYFIELSYQNNKKVTRKVIVE